MGRDFDKYVRIVGYQSKTRNAVTQSGISRITSGTVIVVFVGLSGDALVLPSVWKDEFISHALSTNSVFCFKQENRHLVSDIKLSIRRRLQYAAGEPFQCKDAFCQERHSHNEEDKTVLRTLYMYNGNSCTREDRLYIQTKTGSLSAMRFYVNMEFYSTKTISEYPP